MSREQRENQVLGRVFRLFLIGIVAECYLFLVDRAYVDSDAATLLAVHRGLQIASAAGLVVMALGLALLYLKREDARLRKLFAWIAGLGAFIGLTSLMMFTLYPKGGSYLCVIVPILTVLGLVYLLFQREFFAIAVILSGAMFTVWVCRKGLHTVNWHTVALTGSILVLIGLAAVAYLTSRIQKQGGRWIGRGRYRVFPAACDYRMLYAAYAVAAAAILLALVMVTTTYYSLWVLGILLFAYAVYYTTKLM